MRLFAPHLSRPAAVPSRVRHLRRLALGRALRLLARSTGPHLIGRTSRLALARDPLLVGCAWIHAAPLVHDLAGRALRSARWRGRWRRWRWRRRWLARRIDASRGAAAGLLHLPGRTIASRRLGVRLATRAASEVLRGRRVEQDQRRGEREAEAERRGQGARILVHQLSSDQMGPALGAPDDRAVVAWSLAETRAARLPRAKAKTIAQTPDVGRRLPSANELPVLGSGGGGCGGLGAGARGAGGLRDDFRNCLPKAEIRRPTYLRGEAAEPTWARPLPHLVGNCGSDRILLSGHFRNCRLEAEVAMALPGISALGRKLRKSSRGHPGGPGGLDAQADRPSASPAPPSFRRQQDGVTSPAPRAPTPRR